MTKTFEIIHGFYDPETICSLFKLNESAGTRGHLFELSKKIVLTNFLFTFVSLTELQTIILAGTLNCFKTFQINI